MNLFHCRRTGIFDTRENCLVIRVIFEVNPYDTTSSITLLINQPAYTGFLETAPRRAKRSHARSYSCNPPHLNIPDSPIPLSMLTEALMLVPGVSITSSVTTCSRQHLGWKGRRVSYCDYTSQVLLSSRSVRNYHAYFS